MSLVTSSPTIWKGPSDVIDHATSEIASGSKLGIDATKKLPGEGFKRP
jgi:4-hydroxy-3-polyprenylbenzoate decarboxylase